MSLSGESYISPRNAAALLFLCLFLSGLGKFFQSCHLCAYPAPLSTTGGTQTYFCLAELTGQTQLRKSRIKSSVLFLHYKTQLPHPDQKIRPVAREVSRGAGGHSAESQLWKNLSWKFSISPWILSGVLWQFPVLSHPPPPNCFSAVKLIRDADEAPNTYCSAPASSNIICQSLCRVWGGWGWINQLISQKGTIAEEQ